MQLFHLLKCGQFHSQSQDITNSKCATSNVFILIISWKKECIALFSDCTLQFSTIFVEKSLNLLLRPDCTRCCAQWTWCYVCQICKWWSESAEFWLRWFKVWFLPRRCSWHFWHLYWETLVCLLPIKEGRLLVKGHAFNFHAKLLMALLFISGIKLYSPED